MKTVVTWTRHTLYVLAYVIGYCVLYISYHSVGCQCSSVFLASCCLLAHGRLLVTCGISS